MANKLKLEDTCLTVEQAKELQKLGVDFSEPIHHFYRYIEEKGSRNIVGPWLIINEKVCQTCGMGSKSEFVPTLTNSEMMNMLPVKYNQYEEYYHLTMRPNYVGEYMIFYKRWEDDVNGPSYCKGLLRDSLFETIKYLKINKLM